MLNFVIHILQDMSVCNFDGDLVSAILLLGQVDDEAIFELLYIADLRTVDEPFERFLSSIQE
jgi:hypothetical protein